ncbi:hypothetical protein BCV72DRAFT_328292, partial [Rhizopus microsporus var. microsporus]
KAAGVDFQKNCVFIDEAGFSPHQIRSRAWSVKGTPVIVKVPAQRGIDLSIVGCISPFGTISFSKRKAKTEEIPRTKVKKGATVYHVVHFVRGAMDVLDKYDKKSFYIVMNNCRVHHSH